ncbi:dnaJ homolog subfamily C member 4-like isoform X9 [Mercenaria mercenaria]|uniref:dnaJ homolog subfamily C member 4-like isoform X9 n=1 Tax=Mercenaria mercenaria TaxID=6596 RepID=UPI00234EE840|nr:dnaJ homolog subfamily C member 4-like isoform X9 [Mercenaria mercenaria]
MKVTDIKQNTSMLFNITLCKACLQRLVATNKFVRLKSHYAVLGVSNTATQKQIRDAYLKLSKQHHPDQNRQDPKSHEKFVKINEAYEVLSKDSSRRSYDDSVRVRNQPRPNFRTSHRPPNYYSSGQFYEDQGPFSDHNQYDPYSKRNAGSHYDPFSSYGYEHYQRQREAEAWERGSASKSKMLFYLGLYATVVFFFSFRNIRQEKRLVHTSLSDKASVNII